MIAITPTETGGQFWVRVSMDGHKMRRHGPFADADEAEVTAVRLAAVCRVMNTDVHMQAAAGRKR
jgi:hypothetical protein